MNWSIRNPRIFVIVASCVAAVAASAYAIAPARTEWSEITTAAAAGYCISRHPYVTNSFTTHTSDGYEIPGPPGVVGAVRRNFVHARSTLAVDEGRNNTCSRACAEFGKLYPKAKGMPLNQKSASGALVASGIGDMGSLAVRDKDFATDAEVVAGIWSRSNTWQESDVAPSDFCCCQVKSN